MNIREIAIGQCFQIAGSSQPFVKLGFNTVWDLVKFEEVSIDPQTKLEVIGQVASISRTGVVRKFSFP